MEWKTNIPPTILITGSTGFVCRYLVTKILLNSNFNIVLTYRVKKGNYNKNNRLSFEKADLLKPQSFEGIFSKYNPKYVVHLAAMARVSDGENYPAEVLKTNYIATITLSELLIKYKVESMVFTSSNLAQDPVSVVGIGKLLVEQYFQKLNSQTTKFISLRMPNVIDSNGAVTLIFKKQIENDNPITITHPDMSRMFITGERAADFLYFLVKHGANKGVYVSYEKPVKITDLAENMIKESGKHIKIDFIGKKRGEKLTEKSFTLNEVITTDISGLGMIKEYKYELNYLKAAMEILNDKEDILSDKDIQNSFKKL